VVKGDNLWAIAAARLSDAAGPSADSDRVAAYWRKVIELNRPTLRSGDPNLIYPGEMISLPPIGGAS
jgi:nucleoid-associated protein YgaU